MRLFLAIDFHEKIKESLLNKISILQKEIPSLRWIKKQSLHLTLKFLGETDSTLQKKIESTLNTAFQTTDTFELTTSITGFFPNLKKARVYYLGLDYSDSLRKCYEIIENNLFELGIEKEKRRFSPHITLARVKNISLSLNEQKNLLGHESAKNTISVNQITLMQSDFTTSGVRYTPVQRFSLRYK